MAPNTVLQPVRRLLAASLTLGVLFAPVAAHEPVGERNEIAAPHSDPSAWQLWWMYQGERILAIRARVHALHPELLPAPEQVNEDVVPLLLKVLENESQRDLVGCAAVALGKCARRLDDVRPTLDALRPLLRHDELEIAESAVLALGLTGAVETVADLTALARDDDAGRKIAARDMVPSRLRVRALYSLCLLSEPAADASVDAEILRTARKVLADSVADPGLPADLPVAAIITLGSLGHAPDAARATETLDAALRILDTLPDSLTEPVVAHAPIATAKLLRRSHTRGLDGSTARLRTRLGQWRTMLDDLVQDPPKPSEHPSAVVDGEVDLPLGRSIVSAIGWTAGLVADQEPGDAWTPLLVRTFESSLEPHARYLALMALGELGGERALDFLLKILGATDDAEAANWTAAALGVHAHTNPALDDARSEAIAAALLARLDRVADSAQRQPIVIALGLLGRPAAIAPLRELLPRVANQDELAGRVALSLALLQDVASTKSIRELYDASSRRPARAEALGQALLLLGDQSVVEAATKSWDQNPQNLVSRAVAAYLIGISGDRRALPTLLHHAAADREKPLGRAFAVVALGSLCDPSPTPWSAPIADHVAYRSAPPTLTDTVAGVLDVL